MNSAELGHLAGEASFVAQMRAWGRCGKPCLLRDSESGNGPSKVHTHHHCIREPDHEGDCDFIGTCARGL